MTPPLQGKLIYSSAPWKIYEQDAGMGERDYAVMVDDIFYCRTDDSQTAMKIVETICSRPTPSPQIKLLYPSCTKCQLSGKPTTIAEDRAIIRNAKLDEFMNAIEFRFDDTKGATMTDYHPVTKEELKHLMSWSTHKSPQVCQYERRLEILKRIEARLDPLALLEAWLRVQYELSGKIDISKVRVFVKRLRTNPEAVRQQGIDEGWWK